MRSHLSTFCWVKCNIRFKYYLLAYNAQRKDLTRQKVLRRWCRPLQASELWEAISVLCKLFTFKCIIISENRPMQVLPKGLNLSVITHQWSYVNVWIFSCMNIESIVVILQTSVSVHVFQFCFILETEFFFFLLSHTFLYLVLFTYFQNYTQCPKFFLLHIFPSCNFILNYYFNYT